MGNEHGGENFVITQCRDRKQLLKDILQWLYKEIQFLKLNVYPIQILDPFWEVCRYTSMFIGNVQIYWIKYGNLSLNSRF